MFTQVLVSPRFPHCSWSLPSRHHQRGQKWGLADSLPHFHFQERSSRCLSTQLWHLVESAATTFHLNFKTSFLQILRIKSNTKLAFHTIKQSTLKINFNIRILSIPYHLLSGSCSWERICWQEGFSSCILVKSLSLSSLAPPPPSTPPPPPPPLPSTPQWLPLQRKSLRKMSKFPYILTIFLLICEILISKNPIKFFTSKNPF